MSPLPLPGDAQTAPAHQGSLGLERFQARQVDWVTPARLGWLVLSVLSLLAGLGLTVINPIAVVGAVLAIAGLVLLFYYPVLGVLAYLVFEYARPAAMYPILQPLQLGKVIVAATLVMWIVGMIAHRRFNWVHDRVNVLMLIWVGLCSLSFAAASNTEAVAEGLEILAKFVAAYLLMIQLLDTWSKWLWGIWTLLLLNFKLSQFQLRSFARWYDQAGDTYAFVAGGSGAGAHYFANGTDFGAAMCIVLPMAAASVRATRNPLLKGLAVVMALAFTASILRSGSRGAAVALFAMAIVFWLKSSRKLLVGVVVALFMVGFYAYAPPEWKQKVQSGIEYSEDRTASHRLRLWESGIRMAMARPATGVGKGNFAAENVATGGSRHAPHSIWIEALAELGFPGFLVVVGIVYLGFRRNYQTRRTMIGDDNHSRAIRSFSHALDLSITGFLVAGSFTSILYYPFLFVLFAFVITLEKIASGSVAPEAIAARYRR